MSSRPPVNDWATDFDHTDPRWMNDPFPIWDGLRTRCPIAHTERFQGAYFPSRYQDVRDISYDTEHFSSRRVIVRDEKLDPPIPSPPITSDPPEHRPARMPLLPPFNPKAVERLKPGTQALCARLIDAFIASGRCDAATDYAQHIPTRVIAHMLGVPEADGELFRHWIKLALEEGIHDMSKALQAVGEMTVYFRDQIAKRASQHGDDLISYMLALRHDGKPIPEDKLLGTLRLILIAGIDTTWSAIGASLWHLATHDEDRRRLVADPSLMDTAVEEFLRAYAPVTMAREVVKEVEINGCPMKPGHMVLLSFPAANRDPEMFPDADKVILDRQENRHAAFGLGIHRCIGSNLARMELRTALEEWLKRIPEFRLEDPAGVRWSEGTVRGPRQMPMLFAPEVRT
ncbi:MAG: cytochrome P450 [Betaproteobacteria bacterium]|nr:cytochrome P450 [Betaproteobacteria bacterium]